MASRSHKGETRIHLGDSALQFCSSCKGAEVGAGIGFSDRWLSSKESVCRCRRPRSQCSVPGLGWSPGRGNGNPLQYSFFYNIIIVVFFFFLNTKNILYWGIANEPIYVNFRWTVKGLSHTYTCIHSSILAWIIPWTEDSGTVPGVHNWACAQGGAHTHLFFLVTHQSPFLSLFFRKKRPYDWLLNPMNSKLMLMWTIATYKILLWNSLWLVSFEHLLIYLGEGNGNPL